MWSYFYIPPSDFFSRTTHPKTDTSVQLFLGELCLRGYSVILEHGYKRANSSRYAIRAIKEAATDETHAEDISQHHEQLLAIPWVR